MEKLLTAVKSHSGMIPWMTFFLAIILMQTHLLYDSFHAPKNLLLIAFALILGPVWVGYKIVSSGRFKLSLGLIGIILLVRMFFIFFTKQVWHADALSFYILLSLFFCYLVSVNNTYDYGKKLILPLAASIFFSGFVLSFIGIYQFTLPEIYTPKALKTYVTGSFGSPNAFGNWLAISLLSGIYLFLKQTKITQKVLIIIVSAIVLLVLIMTESRGALFVLIFSISIGYLIKRKSTVKIISTLSVLLLIVFVTLFYLNPGSSFGRIYIWEITLKMFADHPFFGIGIGNFGNEFISYQAQYLESVSDMYSKAAFVRSSHNEYLQSFAEGGIIGGLLFFIPTVYLLYRVYFLIKEDKAEENMYALAAITVILVHSFFDSILHFTPQLILIYIFLGIYDKKIIQVSVRKKVRMVLIPLLLFCSIGVSFIIIDHFKGRYFWAQGNRYAELAIPDVSEQYLNEAIKYLPEKGELLFHYGATLSLNGKPERGLYFLNKAKRSFRDKNLYLSISNAYLEINNFETAILYADSTLYFYPGLLAPNLIKGQAYFELGNMEKSKEALLKCINEEAIVRSGDTKQIADEALMLWKKYGYSF